MSNPINIDPLKDIENAVQQVSDVAEKSNRKVFKKYPITFSFFSLFGFAAVLYGFERTFDQIQFFREQPWIALVVGLIILVGTGTIYKWLQNRTISLK